MKSANNSRQRSSPPVLLPLATIRGLKTQFYPAANKVNKVNKEPQFVKVACDDTNLGGKRFSTDWLVNKRKYRVSSVNNNYVCETMIFPYVRVNSTDPRFIALAADHEYRESIAKQGQYLEEYLTDESN